MALSDQTAGGTKGRTSHFVERSLRLIVMFLGMSWLVFPTTGAEPAGSGEALVIRLVHPERQAARVLSLFEGSRAAHPAAALAAWKRATHDPGQLGKPLEAVIAFFNPEMAAEWRVFHDAELHLDLDATNGKARWYLVVPRDDGTVAAAITATRLTDGGEEPPLVDQGNPLAVERLGQPGAPVSSQVGDTLVLASSRDELMRGLRRTQASRRPGEGIVVQPTDGQAPNGLSGPVPGTQLDSGLIFDLDPAGLAVAKSGSLGLRRAVELIRGLGCRRLRGTLALKGDRLGLELTTSLDRAARPAQADGSAAIIDPAWLEGIPSAGVMGVISLALDPSAAFWDSAFVLADRVERIDPARAAVAPLRVRINLLAASAGVRPEVDLWPHLRGVTASLMGDPNQPGRPTGLLLVLHADAVSSAERLTNEFLPRLRVLLPGGNRGEGRIPDVPDGKAAAKTAAGESRRIGRLGGRALMVWRRDRNVLVAWGDDPLINSLLVNGKPEQSVAVLCKGWAREGRGAPQRVGAVWPARCSPTSHGLDAATPALRVLADDPPVVWWGWSAPAVAHDSFECPELRERVRRFLDQVPQNPPRTR
ncbi:MAG TPA: hypothetical protein VKA15_09450 [Isosphaeraceae bacterium]|nr:hypothetical protein [Isosphaeraceae bacterium]